MWASFSLSGAKSDERERLKQQPRRQADRATSKALLRNARLLALRNAARLRVQRRVTPHPRAPGERDHPPAPRILPPPPNPPEESLFNYCHRRNLCCERADRRRRGADPLEPTVAATAVDSSSGPQPRAKHRPVYRTFIAVVPSSDLPIAWS